MPGKGGKLKYHFSQDPDGTLAKAIPEGYEVYEDIRGQVYLRRQIPEIISRDELAMVNQALERQPKDCFYQMEVKKNAIVIYEARDRSDWYASMAMPWISKETLRESSRRTASFQAVMRFVLNDAEKRLFSAERYCFRGSVDDWISISMDPAALSVQLKKFIKHLGKESFFDLYANG
jgi:hypothetical protein